MAQRVSIDAEDFVRRHSKEIIPMEYPTGIQVKPGDLVWMKDGAGAIVEACEVGRGVRVHCGALPRWALPGDLTFYRRADVTQKEVHQGQRAVEHLHSPIFGVRRADGEMLFSPREAIHDKANVVLAL